MSWMIFPIICRSKSWRALGWVALKTGRFFQIAGSSYLSLSFLRRRSWKKMKSIWQRPQKVLARAVPIWFSPKTRTLVRRDWPEVEDFFCSCEFCVLEFVQKKSGGILMVFLEYRPLVASVFCDLRDDCHDHIGLGIRKNFFYLSSPKIEEGSWSFPFWKAHAWNGLVEPPPRVGRL